MSKLRPILWEFWEHTFLINSDCVCGGLQNECVGDEKVINENIPLRQTSCSKSIHYVWSMNQLISTYGGSGTSAADVARVLPLAGWIGPNIYHRPPKKQFELCGHTSANYCCLIVITNLKQYRGEKYFCLCHLFSLKNAIISPNY